MEQALQQMQECIKEYTRIKETLHPVAQLTNTYSDMKSTMHSYIRSEIMKLYEQERTAFQELAQYCVSSFLRLQNREFQEEKTKDQKNEVKALKEQHKQEINKVKEVYERELQEMRQEITRQYKVIGMLKHELEELMDLMAAQPTPQMQEEAKRNELPLAKNPVETETRGPVNNSLYIITEQTERTIYTEANSERSLVSEESPAEVEKEQPQNAQQSNPLAGRYQDEQPIPESEEQKLNKPCIQKQVYCQSDQWSKGESDVSSSHVQLEALSDRLRNGLENPSEDKWADQQKVELNILDFLEVKQNQNQGKLQQRDGGIRQNEKDTQEEPQEQDETSELPLSRHSPFELAEQYSSAHYQATLWSEPTPPESNEENPPVSRKSSIPERHTIDYLEDQRYPTRKNTPMDITSEWINCEYMPFKKKKPRSKKTKEFLKEFRRSFNKGIERNEKLQRSSCDRPRARNSAKQEWKGGYISKSRYMPDQQEPYVQRDHESQIHYKTCQQKKDQSETQKSILNLLKQLDHSNRFNVGCKKIELKYEGEKKGGMRCGQGVLYYTNGLCYEGTFQDNLRSGYGILKFNHIEIYNGDWVKDELAGQGKIRNCAIINKNKLKAASEPLSKWISYCGQFSQNKFQGLGTLYLQGGQRFCGQFAGGQANGEGTFYRKSGVVEKGLWKNGYLIETWAS